MSKNIKHINYFILTFALVLFSISTNAQEVRVIDNKGTIQTIRNNTVTTSTTISNPTGFSFTTTPVQNDTYIYTPSNAEKVYYIFDGINWNMLAPTKAARVFYPPSILVPASTTGAQPTIDLYQMYRDQFTSPVAQSDATATIPFYERDELYYFVTDADATVFDVNPASANKISITSGGIMSYYVLTPPTDDNAIINVVFVVK